MDERVIHLRVGAVVICAALITGSLIFLFGEGWRSQYTVYVEPSKAPGVSKGTPVRKNGILIGRVQDVQTQERGVLLTLKINSDDKIYDDEVLQIGTESFLGDAVIEVLPGEAESRGEAVADGHRFASNADNVRVKASPMDAINTLLEMQSGIGDLVTQWKDTGKSIDKAASGIHDVSVEIQNAFGNKESDFKAILENTRRLTEKADVALGNLNKVFEGSEGLFADAEYRKRIREGIEQIPDLITEMRTAVSNTNETITSFREASKGLQTNLDNIEKFTKSLGDEGPAFLKKLNHTMNGVDELVSNVNNFAKGFSLKSGGSFAKIMNDPSIYNDLSVALKNIKEITIKLQPLVDDFRTVGDGLAREPGQLGLRGLIRPGALGSGSKPNLMLNPRRSEW